jgi:hypothetical protein
VNGHDQAALVHRLLGLADPRTIAEVIAAALVDAPAYEADRSISAVCAALAKELTANARGNVAAEDVATRLEHLARRHLELLQGVPA